MRVLYCNKYNFAFSGTEVYLLELMQLMRAHGHQTALFSMADNRGEAGEFNHYMAPVVEFKNHAGGWMHKAWLAAHAIYSLRSRRQVRRMIEAFQPDIAHVRNIYHHLSPSILWELRAQRVPVVYHLNDFKLLCPSYNMVAHGRACEECCGGQFWNVVKKGCYTASRAQAFVLAAEAYVHKWLHTYENCVDHLIAPSEFVKSKFVENGWDGGRITVVTHFQSLPPGPVSEPEPGAPIFCFGRLSAEKGVADLLLAMQQLPHIRLRIAGEGPQETTLREMAERLGLANVQFLGHLNSQELGKEISQSLFTVMPSRAYETMGKAILESYAHGRAVVASDLGSRREVVEDGETGLLVEAGNVRQLACAIAFLFDRPELAAKMGCAGRERVATRHQPAEHLRAITSLYETLLERRECSPVQQPSRPQVKVAFIGGRGVVSRYSGIEAYYEEVGRRLAQRGHQVTVYCRNYFTPPADEHDGMKLLRLPTIRSKHLDTLVHTLLSTAHVVGSGCDVVHYHALGPALFSFLPRLAGKKTVVTVQGLDWQRKKWGKIAAMVLRFGEWASVHLPDQTMVVSRTLRDYYRQRYGAETLYIPNGTELSTALPADITRDWGLEPGGYALFLGRFSPEKNCHLLVQAFERLNTPIKLVMAGGSSYSDAYANELRTHASDKIRLFDWVSGDALKELLTNALLFVLPSDLEGLSLALLDAMGAGICVLTSDIPENRELVDGVGFTFRRGDVTDLERMLNVLLSNPRICREAGRRGQERIRERYLWPQITEQIEQAYLDLMGWSNKTARDASQRRLPAEAVPAERELAA
jgi:glycosyltransferase involved in cell wall biosynthesis